jgi:chemotaxis protein MotB
MSGVAGIEIKDETAPQPSQSRQLWLITLADLVSLLLAFFVMLFAMSNVKLDEWRTLVDVLSRALNPSLDRSKAMPMMPFNIGAVFRRQAVNLDYLASVLKEAVSRDPLLEKSVFMRLDDQLVIALPGDLLFEPGRAALTERAREGLFTLGGVLRNIGNQIAVNGHADPIPAGTGEYASNWEMSLARAAAVANVLTRAGYPDNVMTRGYADTRYRQLPASMGEEERRAINRRVDVVILPTVALR